MKRTLKLLTTVFLCWASATTGGASQTTLTSAEEQLELIEKAHLPKTPLASFQQFESIFEQNATAVKKQVQESFPERVEDLDKVIKEAQDIFSKKAMNSKTYMYFHLLFAEFLSDGERNYFEEKGQKKIFPVFLKQNFWQYLEEKDEEREARNEVAKYNWIHLNACTFLPVILENPLFSYNFMNTAQSKRIALVGIPLRGSGYDGLEVQSSLSFCEHDLRGHADLNFQLDAYLLSIGLPRSKLNPERNDTFMHLRETLYSHMQTKSGEEKSLEEWIYFQAFHEMILGQRLIQKPITYSNIKEAYLENINILYSSNMRTLDDYWKWVAFSIYQLDSQKISKICAVEEGKDYDENSKEVKCIDIQAMEMFPVFEYSYADMKRLLKEQQSSLKEIGVDIPLENPAGEFDSSGLIQFMKQEGEKFFKKYEKHFKDQ